MSAGSEPHRGSGSEHHTSSRQPHVHTANTSTPKSPRYLRPAASLRRKLLREQQASAAAPDRCHGPACASSLACVLFASPSPSPPPLAPSGPLSLPCYKLPSSPDGGPPLSQSDSLYDTDADVCASRLTCADRPDSRSRRSRSDRASTPVETSPSSPNSIHSPTLSPGSPSVPSFASPSLSSVHSFALSSAGSRSPPPLFPDSAPDYPSSPASPPWNASAGDSSAFPTTSCTSSAAFTCSSGSGAWALMLQQPTHSQDLYDNLLQSQLHVRCKRRRMLRASPSSSPAAATDCALPSSAIPSPHTLQRDLDYTRWRSPGLSTALSLPVSLVDRPRPCGLCLLQDLPLELSIRIFSFLDISALCAVAATSHRVKAASEDWSLWSSLFIRRWPVSCARDEGSWKKMYREADLQEQDELLAGCDKADAVYFRQMQTARRHMLHRQQPHSPLIMSSRPAAAAHRGSSAGHSHSHSHMRKSSSTSSISCSHAYGGGEGSVDAAESAPNEFDLIDEWRRTHPMVPSDRDHTRHPCSANSCSYYTHGHIYICEQTGKVHFCGKECNAQIVERDAEVCCISGRTRPRHESEGDQEGAGLSVGERIVREEREAFEDMPFLAQCFEYGYGCDTQRETTQVLYHVRP